MNQSAGNKPAFVVVGCGKVGTSLARFLSLSGYPAIATVSRSAASARQAAEASGAAAHGTDPGTFVRQGQLVLITTPDGEIEKTCAQIASGGGFASEAVVLHCSGALPSTILASARESGARIGSLHPLQSFAAPALNSSPFLDIIFAVEGEDAAVEAAEAVARDLGGRSLRVKTEGKGLYHAAAVVASNYLVCLLDMAYCLLDAAGISQEAAAQILSPLIEGTLANTRKMGPPKALTGPIARGDRQTVQRHLRQIRRFHPQLADLYADLGRHTVDVARRGGHLTAEGAEAFLALFAGADGRETE